MGPRKRADNPAVPKPYVLSPSGAFDGNDGRWSSFYINIGADENGSQGQNFKVLVSTSMSLTLIPNEAGWCNPECAARRGVQIYEGSQSLGFDYTKSHGWEETGIQTVPLPEWWTGEKFNATYGTESVGLGESSPNSRILQQQNVARYQSEELFMGTFGLSQTIVRDGAGSREPFLSNFAYFEQIPSKSFGYTAGAWYRNSGNGIPGNVVLGGYDEARIRMDKGLNLTMPNEKNNTLAVGISSITYKPRTGIEANEFSFTGEEGGFQATIDSTLPYLVLPDRICDQFVERFNLEWDNRTELYTVSDQASRDNSRTNATVTFKVTKNERDSINATSIDLPYSAFDVQASYPLTTNTSGSTQYFPIKRSTNGKFVLGRAFLQEAYLVVDYERSTFTVAPAIYSDPMPQEKLVSIYNTSYSPSPTPTLIPQQGDDGLSPGAIAGIVVGIVVAFLLAALGYFLWWRRRRAAQAAQAAPPYAEKPPEMTNTEVAGSEVKSHRISELDSEPPNSPKPSLVGYYDREGKNISPYPPISEMESPPAELYSPPAVASTPRSEGGGSDYFVAGTKIRRSGKESSGRNTPGTPNNAVELPGDDGKYQVGGMHFDPMESPKLSPAHSRGTSDTSLKTNIDEVVARNEASPERKQNLANVKEENEDGAALERRPSSHQRGLSDTTVQSDDTAVSAMTPDEMERWALGNDNSPTRPLSE